MPRFFIDLNGLEVGLFSSLNIEVTRIIKGSVKGAIIVHN